MFQIEQRILEFYKAVLIPSKEKAPASFSDLHKYTYLLDFLYELNPKNQVTIEQWYFVNRKMVIKHELDVLHNIFK